MKTEFIIEMTAYQDIAVLKEIQKILLKPKKRVTPALPWTPEEVMSFVNLWYSLVPMTLLEDILITPEPQNDKKGILTTTISSLGVNPINWLISDYWQWLPKDDTSFVKINVGFNKAHFSFMIKKYSNGKFSINRYSSENPISKMSLRNTINAIEDLQEISTHLSPQLYAKIECKGVSAMKTILLQKDASLDSILTKLQETLRKAIDRESRGVN